MAFSVLLRCLSSQNHCHLPRGAAGNAHFFSHHHRFSSLSSVQTTSSAPSSSSSLPKPSSLSARMSFVFDQIDAIKKEQSQKDETLQRIRAWRKSKMNKETSESLPTPAACDNQTQFKISTDSVPNLGKLGSVGELELRREEDKGGGLLSKEAEFVHPWPEWIALMERLVQQNYFDHMRKDEDRMVKAAGFDMSEVAEEGFDFTRDWKTAQTAVLKFGRDRFDILKSLSRQDIQILVGYGCPSSDKKVVFSAKLLRKHVHLDEGDVCSSCSLRSSCEKAYLLTSKEDEARTIDVMRVLLMYGFDPLNGSVINKSLLKIKSVTTVVRKLLHMLVKLSAVPIDPNLLPPVIKKPPPKVKQPPPPPKKRVGRDDIELKKGDWLCTKCDFMNFSKNLVCLQCDAKRPKRQLLPGEWECPECNFLNYRRNVVCFHCECKRPRDDPADNRMLERSRGPKSRMETISKRPDVSNAWNFDFDDNESDGADVAAFEYADSHKLDEYFPLDSRAQKNNLQEDDFYKNSRRLKMHEREHSDHGPEKPDIGFDDFDDEEDDVDSYELDTQDNKPLSKTSIAFSELKTDSESEHIEDTNDRWQAGHRSNSPPPSKSFKRIRQKASLSGLEDDEVDIDSDDDLPVHPKWKSSHVADSKQRNNRGRGKYNLSDDELSFGSCSEGMDDEDFGSRKNKVHARHSSQKDSRRGSCGGRDKPFSGLDSDDEDLHFRKDGVRGNKVGQNRRNSSRDTFNVYENSRFRSNSMIGEKKNKFKADLDRPSRDSYGNDRGSQGDGYGKLKREGFSNQQRGRWDNSGFRSDIGGHFEVEERNRRPRLNV